MEILKIQDNKGLYYSPTNNCYYDIDKIDSDELFDIIKYILSNDDIKLVEPNTNEETNISSKAQYVVYKDIYAKLIFLIENKTSFINEIDEKYKAAFDKYSNIKIENNQ